MLVLGLSPIQPLTALSLKDAFRESAKRWHPDLHQQSQKASAEVQFKKAQLSYQFLQSVLLP